MIRLFHIVPCKCILFINIKVNIIIKEKPYVVFSNDTYTGFCIELLDKISAMCNFTYEIRNTEDTYPNIVQRLAEKVIKILVFFFFYFYC